MRDRDQPADGKRRREARTGRGRPPLSAHCLDDCRILVAEDEIIIAMEVQDALEGAGGEVVGPAFTLVEALELASSAVLNAAVLDFRLGDNSADRVARALTDRGVPFLFYTGQTTADPERAKWPDIATVSKPASGGAIVRAMVTLLDR